MLEQKKRSFCSYCFTKLHSRAPAPSKASPQFGGPGIQLPFIKRNNLIPPPPVAQTRSANVKGKKLGFEQRNPNDTKASLSFQFAGLYANFYHLFGAWLGFSSSFFLFVPFSCWTCQRSLFLASLECFLSLSLAAAVSKRFVIYANDVYCWKGRMGTQRERPPLGSPYFPRRQLIDQC